MPKSALCLAAGSLTALLSIAAGPAAAAEDSFAFHYNKRDLTTQPGSQKVYERLQREAMNDCVDPGVAGIYTRIASEKCYAATVSAVIEEIDDPALSRLHRGG